MPWLTLMRADFSRRAGLQQDADAPARAGSAAGGLPAEPAAARADLPRRGRLVRRARVVAGVHWAGTSLPRTLRTHPLPRDLPRAAALWDQADAPARGLGRPPAPGGDRAPAGVAGPAGRRTGHAAAVPRRRPGSLAPGRRHRGVPPGRGPRAGRRHRRRPARPAPAASSVADGVRRSAGRWPSCSSGRRPPGAAAGASGWAGCCSAAATAGSPRAAHPGRAWPISRRCRWSPPTRPCRRGPCRPPWPTWTAGSTWRSTPCCGWTGPSGPPGRRAATTTTPSRRCSRRRPP